MDSPWSFGLYFFGQEIVIVVHLSSFSTLPNKRPQRADDFRNKYEAQNLGFCILINSNNGLPINISKCLADPSNCSSNKIATALLGQFRNYVVSKSAIFYPLLLANVFY